MITINATKKLTIRHFDKFEKYIDNVSASLFIDDICILPDLSKDVIIDIFKSNALDTIDDNRIIKFETSEAQLLITGNDYKKWTNPWWANRIFKKKELQEKTAKTVKEVFNIECFLAKRKLDTLEIYDEISIETTNKKDVIKFINENTSKLTVQARLENAEVVYLLRYVDEDYHTFRNFDELLLDGKFIV